MRTAAVILGMLVIGLGLAACGPHLYTGPGCRIELYSLSGFRGLIAPIVRDAPELVEEWRKPGSMRVVFGTWRLYADQDYKNVIADYDAPAEIPALSRPGQIGSLQCIRPAPSPPSGY
jgi:hypothetical protein